MLRAVGARRGWGILIVLCVYITYRGTRSSKIFPFSFSFFFFFFFGRGDARGWISITHLPVMALKSGAPISPTSIVYRR